MPVGAPQHPPSAPAPPPPPGWPWQIKKHHQGRAHSSVEIDQSKSGAAPRAQACAAANNAKGAGQWPAPRPEPRRRGRACCGGGNVQNVILNTTTPRVIICQCKLAICCVWHGQPAQRKAHQAGPGQGRARRRCAAAARRGDEARSDSRFIKKPRVIIRQRNLAMCGVWHGQPAQRKARQAGPGQGRARRRRPAPPRPAGGTKREAIHDS